MGKIKNFIKNTVTRFCIDKKFNSICLTIVELPLLILGLAFNKFALVIYGSIGLAILNILIKKIYQIYIVKKLKKSIVIENTEKGGKSEC